MWRQLGYLEAIEADYEDGWSFPTLGTSAVYGWLLAQGKASFTVEDHQAIVALLAAKQHDYGHENILKHGIEGVRVRIWDKIARLRNLLGRDAPKHESIADTWLDLIGYSVIGVLLDRGTFTLPLASDVKPTSATPAGAGAAGRVLRVFGSGRPAKQFDIDTVGEPRLMEPIWTLLNENPAVGSVTIQFDGGIIWSYEVAR